MPSTCPTLSDLGFYGTMCIMVQCLGCQRRGRLQAKKIEIELRPARLVAREDFGRLHAAHRPRHGPTHDRLARRRVAHREGIPRLRRLRPVEPIDVDPQHLSTHDAHDLGIE